MYYLWTLKKKLTTVNSATQKSLLEAKNFTTITKSVMDKLDVLSLYPTPVIVNKMLQFQDQITFSYFIYDSFLMPYQSWAGIFK